MAPTDRQPTESHLAAARSRMVSIQSSLHACVGRHLFSDCAASPAGAGLARAALPAGGDQEERRAASFSDCAASPAGAGLARVARLSPACRRRSGGAGRHFSRTTRHRRPGGIGSHGSPFPCLPAAIRRSGGGAGQAHFFRTARLHWPGRDWLARLAFPLPAGGDPTIWGSGGATGGIFFRTAPHRRPGGIGSRGSPFPCLPAASGGAAGGIFFGIRGIVRRGGIGSRGSPFPCLPAAIRRYSRQASFFGLRGIAGRDGIGSHCSPFPCLPAASLQEPEMPKGYFFILACSFG